MNLKTGLKILALSACSLSLLTACGKGGSADVPAPSAAPDVIPAGWADASATFINADGEETGQVAFKEAANGGVLIRVSLIGLPQGWHGIHLHQVGDCSDGADGFKVSGGHIDPDQREHGLMNMDGPEAADLPNLYANATGTAVAEFWNAKVSLHDDQLSDADGFAVVAHRDPDDQVTQPIGGAGARIACAAVHLGE